MSIESNNGLHIPVPNLQILLHHYSQEEHLFRTVTMCSEEDRERLLDEIAETRTWYWGRYSRRSRRDYMRERLFVENRLYEAFSRKYERPKNRHPVFFYLYPSLDLRLIDECIRERRRFEEMGTTYLLVDIRDLEDLSSVSFTLDDSHRSFRNAMVERGILSTDVKTPPRADHGEVFRIEEMAEVYSRHADEAVLVFEVQVWDPAVLDRWRGRHYPFGATAR